MDWVLSHRRIAVHRARDPNRNVQRLRKEAGAYHEEAMSLQTEIFQQMFDSCSTLDRWNEFVVPAMKSEGEELKMAAAREAKKRGYRADKILGIYIEPVEMKPTKGHNLISIGYAGGWLYAGFGSGKTYRYKDVPQEEFFKLQRSPYPDSLFAHNVKGKFECEPVETKSPGG
jgi:hypothetical protein